jgi:hypothetical protein
MGGRRVVNWIIRWLTGQNPTADEQQINQNSARIDRQIIAGRDSREAGRDYFEATSLTLNYRVDPPGAPEVNGLSYLLDRWPQRESLRRYLERNPLDTAPLCIVIVGHGMGMPDAVARTLRSQMQRLIIQPQKKDQFETQAGNVPILTCLEDPKDDLETLWRRICRDVFSLADGEYKDDSSVRKCLQDLTASMAFGLKLNAANWDRTKPLALKWIGEISGMKIRKTTVVIVFLVVEGRPSQSETLEKIRTDLEDDYRASGNVLILPPLSKVTRADIEDWFGIEVVKAFGSNFDVAGLQGASLQFFPIGQDERWIGEFWQDLFDQIQRISSIRYRRSYNE